jgi:hypothetical protein
MKIEYQPNLHFLATGRFCLASLGELVNITGKITFNYVSLLIPITLAWLGVGFQPLFVLAYSLILTIFFPHISAENVLGSHLLQKAVSIGSMVAGAFILNA